ACSFMLTVVLTGSLFFFSSRRRHTRFSRDWSSDVCSSDLMGRMTKAKPMLQRCFSQLFFQQRKILGRPGNDADVRDVPFVSGAAVRQPVQGDGGCVPAPGHLLLLHEAPAGGGGATGSGARQAVWK